MNLKDLWHFMFPFELPKIVYSFLRTYNKNRELALIECNVKLRITFIFVLNPRVILTAAGHLRIRQWIRNLL